MKIDIIIGAYGSGKSEFAVNYAWQKRQKEKKVALVDMDVVNPYFRSREIKGFFAENDIELVAPEGEYIHSHLPMLSPRIMGAVEDFQNCVILDVGGDPAGCRTLARYIENIKKRGYSLKAVINTSRPFTSDYDGIMQMLENLEFSSRLKITELVCNTNLMEFTDEATVLAGVKLLDEIARDKNLKFENYLVMDRFADIVPNGLLGKKRIVLQYFLNKPWEHSARE